MVLFKVKEIYSRTINQQYCAVLRVKVVPVEELLDGALEHAVEPANLAQVAHVPDRLGLPVGWFYSQDRLIHR